MHQFWDHPQLRARGRWHTVESPNGPIPALLPPGINTAYEYRMDKIPGVGEHTERILKELGYSDEHIQNLKENQSI
jgi:itaconate CoA-transferase